MDTYLPYAVGLHKKFFDFPCGTCMLSAQRWLAAPPFFISFPCQVNKRQRKISKIRKHSISYFTLCYTVKPLTTTLQIIMQGLFANSKMLEWYASHKVVICRGYFLSWMKAQLHQSSVKSLIFNYYSRSLQTNYDPEYPITFKNICLLQFFLSLTLPLTCCYWFKYCLIRF